MSHLSHKAVHVVILARPHVSPQPQGSACCARPHVSPRPQGSACQAPCLTSATRQCMPGPMSHLGYKAVHVVILGLYQLSQEVAAIRHGQHVALTVEDRRQVIMVLHSTGEGTQVIHLDSTHEKARICLCF